MKWTCEQIQLLTKKVYGNFLDEDISRKVAELHVHLDKYEKSFLGPHVKREWAEVERLANEINEMIRSYQGGGRKL